MSDGVSTLSERVQAAMQKVEAAIDAHTKNPKSRLWLHVQHALDSLYQVLQIEQEIVKKFRTTSAQNSE